MPRQPRDLKPGYCYHITTRCNNREFLLYRQECREVFLYAIKQAQEKFDFKLYGLCIMSNHVHYLLEPKAPNDLPKIMHWLNWYTAMCFNQMLGRTGHFWEKRYFSAGFPSSDHARVLNTLRYIHANPKTAKMQHGFFYDFSNYGSHERMTNDGITQWHSAFLSLGESLEDCAEAYKQFCNRYKPKEKPAKKSSWGGRLLAKMEAAVKTKRKKAKTSPGQTKLSLPWEQYQVLNCPEIQSIARTFISANSYPISGSP
ncbi:MAG: transposase [Cyanobacteria bacterium P01_F01_bin.150]